MMTKSFGFPQPEILIEQHQQVGLDDCAGTGVHWRVGGDAKN
jgi:hypothetical protein